jgi:hypothetical protein
MNRENCEPSPFVKVRFCDANDAVTIDEPVTEELTNPNALICAEPETTPPLKFALIVPLVMVKSTFVVSLDAETKLVGLLVTLSHGTVASDAVAAFILWLKDAESAVYTA